ncbi:MAG: hypothetical protein ACYTGZ_22150 [Planctomycetota bacterium]
MRITLLLLALAAPSHSAPQSPPQSPPIGDEADEFFELGLGYLKTAFYPEARAAFSESLVRAPGQAVPTALSAVACTAEGRDSRSCAYLLRLAYQRLPARKTFRLDLRTVFRSAEDLRRVEARIAKRLTGTKRTGGTGGSRRRDNLTILAFLQAQDGTPATSPALDLLLKERPGDTFALALKKLRAVKQEPKPKPKKPKADSKPKPKTS